MILVMVASENELFCLASMTAPTRSCPLMLSSVTTVEGPDPLKETRHLTIRLTFLILASQKAPLYLAETSVPSVKTTGSGSPGKPGENEGEDIWTRHARFFVSKLSLDLIDASS